MKRNIKKGLEKTGDIAVEVIAFPIALGVVIVDECKDFVKGFKKGFCEAYYGTNE